MQKKSRTLLSVPDRDGRFNWSPGAEKLPTAPRGGTIRDGLKAEVKFTATSGLRVCVLCRLHIYNTCVLQWVVCAIKKLCVKNGQPRSVLNCSVQRSFRGDPSPRWWPLKVWARRHYLKAKRRAPTSSPSLSTYIPLALAGYSVCRCVCVGGDGVYV